MAFAFREAAHGAGWKETEAALRALESLLELSPRVVLPIQRSIGDKVLEFLGLPDLAYTRPEPTTPPGSGDQTSKEDDRA